LALETSVERKPESDETTNVCLLPGIIASGYPEQYSPVSQRNFNLIARKTNTDLPG